MKIKKVKIYWNWQIRRNRTNTMSQMCRNTMIVSRAVEKRAEYAEMCERVCEENKMIQIDRKQDRHEGIVKEDG